jgi:sec-independent protein translocase protein TatA
MYRLFDNPLHLIILLVVVLIIFGAGKLPGVGSALGQSIKEFKKATNEGDTPQPGQSAVTAQLCQSCSTTIPSGAQFCPSCGAPVRSQIAASPDTTVGSTVFCSSCGAKNAGAARFCAQCGSSMSVHAG